MKPAMAFALTLLWVSTASPTGIACNELDMKIAVGRLMFQLVDLQESAKLAAENLGVAALMDPKEPMAMFLTMHMVGMKEIKRLEDTIQSYHKLHKELKDGFAHCVEPE